MGCKIGVAQVTSPEDGRVRADACVNRANTLSAWAGAEVERGRPGKAADLLAAAVDGYRGALQQEEDAAVGPLQVAHHCRQPCEGEGMRQKTLHVCLMTEESYKKQLQHGCHRAQYTPAVSHQSSKKVSGKSSLLSSVPCRDPAAETQGPGSHACDLS